MNDTQNPFDDMRALIAGMPALDRVSAQSVSAAIATFDGPQPVLGSWGAHLEWIASVQGRGIPALDRPVIAVFAGSHDVAKAKNPNLDVPVAARTRIEGLTHGQASIRGMASHLGAAFKVFEMGLDLPVPDITQNASLSEKDCAAAIAFGMEAVAEGADILVIGNAGLGSATAAAAVVRGLYGGTSEYWAGAHDTNADGRIAAVEAASRFHKTDLSKPLECLRVFAGRDIAGIVGAIIAARYQRIPVILDGFVVCAAAAVLHAVNPDATSHCCVGHVTAEPAHSALLDRLNLNAIHDFGISIGDGSGSLFALSGMRLALAGLETLEASDSVQT